jgi:uncharacterized membrane protein YphA (DoxX/SURF4 family)
MRLSFLSRVFLVALQLAIGWHLFYEGVWKFRNPSWTSKGYVRNATGPFALPIRWTAGDPDVERQGLRFTEADPAPALLDHFTPLEPESGEDVDAGHLHRYLPEALKKHWKDYHDLFIEHYELDKPQNRAQAVQVDRKLTEFENETVRWLKEGEKRVKRKGVDGEITLTTPLRVREYQDAVEELRRIRDEEQGFFSLGASARLRKAKETEATLRNELQNDLDVNYAELKKALREPLTYEQRRMDPPAEPPAPQDAWGRVARIDAAVRWGLTIVGACLIVGFLTRLASVAGSLYLLAFYLAMPALPGMAEPGSPSHFLFINNNIIEILALLAIATSQPGRRYGLDAWLRALCPFGKKAKAETLGGTP